ncbi:MAG TPA: glycosyltransferase [Persephonella sp.]|nr:glycosyltransferase [Persephonella sp.]
MKNKKIFLYTPSLHPGGVFNSNKLLAQGFAKKGYKVKIITNRKTDLEIDGFEHIHLNAGDFIRPFKLKKIILEEKPLAIFSNMQTQNISLALAKIFTSREKINTKFIGFVRNSDAYVKYNKFYKLPLRLIINKLYKKLDKIIAISNSAKYDVIRTFFLNDKNIYVVPNPIEISVLNELKKENIKTEEKSIFKNPTLLYAGRFSKQKRLDLLLNIFKKLNNIYPKLNLVLVGDGEEKGNLIKQIKQKKINNVYFLPFTNNPFKYMSKATLFLLTSYEEGLGRVVVESFACGTPVIAFKNEFSGHVDIIDDGKNGFLVPFADINQFVEKVKILLENENLRKEFSKNAIEKAKEFEINKIISRLEELIYN